MRGILIVDYNPDWPTMYADERGRILGAMDSVVRRIEHIGSTSVPGLGAKPIIDIGCELYAYPLPEVAIRAMEALGYEHMGEYGISGRHYFRRGSPRLYHVHAYSPGNGELQWQLAFRDYLRAHPPVARQYEALKRQLAAEHTDGDEYTLAKTNFVRSVVRLALGEPAGNS